MSGREALKSRAAIVAGACVMALLLPLPAEAIEPLGNGGFETGDLTGWSPAGPPGSSVTVVSSYRDSREHQPKDGGHFALLESPSGATTVVALFAAEYGLLVSEAPPKEREMPPQVPPEERARRAGDCAKDLPPPPDVREFDAVRRIGEEIKSRKRTVGSDVGSVNDQGDFVSMKKTSSGVEVKTLINHRTGVKTVSTLAPDGSSTMEVRDKDGGVVSKAGWGKDGTLREYEPGVTDQVFDSAQPVSVVRYDSGGGRLVVQSDKATLSEWNVVVRSHYKERTEGGSSSTASEDIRLKTVVKKLGPGSGYFVTPVGKPMQASAWGKTREEATTNALGQIASRIRTDIRSETVDYQASTPSGTTEKIQMRLDARSNVAFMRYEVTAIIRDGDGYTVSINATPGMVRPKERR